MRPKPSIVWDTGFVDVPFAAFAEARISDGETGWVFYNTKLHIIDLIDADTWYAARLILSVKIGCSPLDLITLGRIDYHDDETGT